MTLLSSTSNADLNGTGANDVWGWTDPVTGVEYALVGERQGLAIVDLSDPTAPFLAAFMPTQTTSSTWRDMKVYADHAYVVSEANGHGPQVLDLNQLRDLTDFPATLDPTTWLGTFSDAHNVVIDEASGLLYAVGTNLAGGGLVAFDLSDPASPVLVGDYSEADTPTMPRAWFTMGRMLILWANPSSSAPTPISSLLWTPRIPATSPP